MLRSTHISPSTLVSQKGQREPNNRVKYVRKCNINVNINHLPLLATYSEPLQNPAPAIGTRSPPSKRNTSIQQHSAVRQQCIPPAIPSIHSLLLPFYSLLFLVVIQLDSRFPCVSNLFALGSCIPSPLPHNPSPSTPVRLTHRLVIKS